MVIGRGACADTEPLLMMRPPRGVCAFIMPDTPNATPPTPSASHHPAAISSTAAQNPGRPLLVRVGAMGDEDAQQHDAACTGQQPHLPDHAEAEDRAECGG